MIHRRTWRSLKVRLRSMNWIRICPGRGSSKNSLFFNLRPSNTIEVYIGFFRIYPLKPTQKVLKKYALRLCMYTEAYPLALHIFLEISFQCAKVYGIESAYFLIRKLRLSIDWELNIFLIIVKIHVYRYDLQVS